MSPSPNPSFDRRGFLRVGGLTLSMGAILAACGSGRGGSDAPGRIGVAPPRPTLPEVELDDVVRLRTAQSLHHTAIDVYDALTGLGTFDGAESALVERLVAGHTEQAAAVGELITGAGGEEFACGNPFLANRAVAPLLDAIDGSDDVHRDAMNVAFGFESLIAASYQSLVPALEDLALRPELMRVGGEVARNAALLAATINPDALISPALAGEPVENDSDGFPVPYAIPETFGQLTGIDVVVGARNDEGTRFTVQLQTPAANTFVYGYQSC